MTDRPDPPEPPTAGPIPGRPARGHTILGRFTHALRDQNWAAAGLELAIVVFGIVIGFQVTEWGEERDLRERATVQMEALREDFLANRTQLTGVLADQEVAVEQQRELLRVIHGTSPRPDGDRLADLVFSTVVFNRFEPVLGAYDAMLSAGDLRLVRDPALRSDLATFAEMAEAGWEDEDQVHDLRIRMFGLLGEHGDILALVYPPWRESRGFPPSSMAMDFDALLASPEFSTLVTAVAFGEIGVLNYYRSMEERLDAVLAELGVDAQVEASP